MAVSGLRTTRMIYGTLCLLWHERMQKSTSAPSSNFKSFCRRLSWFMCAQDMLLSQLQLHI